MCLLTFYTNYTRTRNFVLVLATLYIVRWGNKKHGGYVGKKKHPYLENRKKKKKIIIIIFCVCLMYLVLLDACNINSLQLQAELHEKM